MKQIKSSYILISLFFILIFSSNSFAENIFKQGRSFTSRTPIIKIAADTGIIESKIAIDDTPVLISNKFSFTEGPAVDKKGNIFFTDQPNDKIWEYNIDGKLSLFLEKTGRSNGLYFDKKGDLLACADEQNQLWSISPEKKLLYLLMI